jgi:GNAT superfamily N-acetyltransferase
MTRLVMEGFQYPENPAWSIQEDDSEGMADQLKGIKRMWPIINAAQYINPTLRDIMRGFIYEEDGKPVGLINYAKPPNRQDEWSIANVTVLPAYRRRGIARKLVEATLQDLRERKARLALLDVIDGNLPAFELYQEMGFEAYTSSVEIDCPAGMEITPPVLTDGWSVNPLPDSSWRIRHEIAQRITPAHVQKFEPITEKRFRPTLMTSTLGKFIDSMSGSGNARLVFRTPNGEVASTAVYSFRKRPGGINRASFLFDPKFAEEAQVFVQYVLSRLQQFGPGRRIQMDVDIWQKEILQALESIGCVKRLSMNRMGLDFGKN